MTLTHWSGLACWSLNMTAASDSVGHQAYRDGIRSDANLLVITCDNLITVVHKTSHNLLPKPPAVQVETVITYAV